MYEIKIDVIRTLPNAKPTLERILTYIKDEDKVDLRELSELVQLDPIISVKLLRLANSPIFGFSCKVDSIDRAIAIVGLESMKALLYSLLAEPMKGLNGLWEHSLFTVAYMRALLQTLPIKISTNVQVLYTGALIHDIGKVVLNTIFPNAYLPLINRLGVVYSSVTVEEEHFYFDHAQIGGLVCKRWYLPERIIQMVEKHHLPYRCREVNLDCFLLHVADVLSLIRCNDLCVTEKIMLPIDSVVWEVLELNEEIVMKVMDIAETEIQKLESLILAKD